MVAYEYLSNACSQLFGVDQVTKIIDDVIPLMIVTRQFFLQKIITTVMWDTRWLMSGNLHDVAPYLGVRKSAK